MSCMRKSRRMSRTSQMSVVRSWVLIAVVVDVNDVMMRICGGDEESWSESLSASYVQLRSGVGRIGATSWLSCWLDTMN